MTLGWGRRLATLGAERREGDLRLRLEGHFATPLVVERSIPPGAIGRRVADEDDPAVRRRRQAERELLVMRVEDRLECVCVTEIRPRPDLDDDCEARHRPPRALAVGHPVRSQQFAQCCQRLECEAASEVVFNSAGDIEQGGAYLTYRYCLHAADDKRHAASRSDECRIALRGMAAASLVQRTEPNTRSSAPDPSHADETRAARS
jgi:hypothetical protein